MPEQPLLSETLRLLECRTESLLQLAKMADVGYSWLYSVKSGRCENPRIQPLEKLHSYLVKTAPRA